MLTLLLAPLLAVLAVPVDARAVPRAVTSTTSSNAPASTAIPSGWAAQSCIAEGSNGRALASAMTSSDGMTWNQCIAYCANAGYSMAGVEFGRECFCSNILVCPALVCLFCFRLALTISKTARPCPRLLPIATMRALAIPSRSVADPRPSISSSTNKGRPHSTPTLTRPRRLLPSLPVGPPRQPHASPKVHPAEP